MKALARVPPKTMIRPGAFKKRPKLEVDRRIAPTNKATPEKNPSMVPKDKLFSVLSGLMPEDRPVQSPCMQEQRLCLFQSLVNNFHSTCPVEFGGEAKQIKS